MAHRESDALSDRSSSEKISRHRITYGTVNDGEASE